LKLYLATSFNVGKEVGLTLVFSVLLQDFGEERRILYTPCMCGADYVSSLLLFEAINF